MAAMRAMKSTATSVKVLAQKTQQMPELIDKAIKRQLYKPDFSKLRLHRDLGTIENICTMEPPKEVVAIDEQIWHSFTEGVLDNLKFLNKEMCCVVSIGACALATVLFSILEASGQIEVDASWFLLLILWFCVSLLGAFLIKMLGLVLFDASTTDLVYKMNVAMRSGDEKCNLYMYYSVRGWINAVRELQIWRPIPPEPTLAASFVNFGSAALAYAMPIPEPGPFGVDTLPPPRSNEVELITNPIESYEVGEVVYSELLTVQNFSFRLAVYPQGFHPRLKCVAAFIEAEAPKDEEWCYRGVKFQVSLINCIDYRASIGRIDRGDFHDVHVDRGWADLLPQELAIAERGWVSSTGSLVLRAACSCTGAFRPDDANARNAGSSPVPPTVYGKTLPAAEVDSIEGLVAKMQANPQDAVLQRHSARSLYDLCVGKDAAAMKRKQQAAEAFALELLIAAMTTHASDSQVQSWAACPVASICSGEDDAGLQRKQRAVKVGALEAMVTAMTSHADEAKVQIWASCMVDRICQGEDDAALDRKQQAAEAGWIEAIINAMKSHGDDEDVQFQASKALYTICLGKKAERWQHQAIKAGGLEILVAALLQHVGDVKVCGSVAATLAILCEDGNSKVKHVAFKAGALEALVATMKAHPDDPRLQSWSAYAAQRISSGDDAAGLKRQKKAKEIHLFPVLLDAVSGLSLAMKSQDTTLQRCALWSIWRISLDPKMLPIAMEAETLDGIVIAMTSHVEDVEVQRNAVNTLYNMCAGEDRAAVERKEAAAKVGSLEAVVASMRMHQSDAELQRDGACAVGNLCISDAEPQHRKLRVAEAGGIEALKDALSFCEGDAEFQEAIKNLIRELEVVLRKSRLKDDGASTVAFLEAAIPTERSHVQLEVDDEPTVPEEPTASMPFAIEASFGLPSMDVAMFSPSLPSSQLRDQRISIQSGGSVSGPVPVMTHNNCPEPAYVPMPDFAEDVSELPV